MKRQRRWNAWAGLCALGLTLAMVTGAALPATRAVVSGGIVRCEGVPSGASQHVPGMVTVLEGHVTWRKSAGPPDYELVLPTTVIDRQAVGGTYRFDLPPGQYVLQSGISYASVTLSAGDHVDVDIPDACI